MSPSGLSRLDWLRATIAARPLRPESRSEIRHAPTTQASAVAGFEAQLAASATARAGNQAGIEKFAKSGVKDWGFAPQSARATTKWRCRYHQTFWLSPPARGRRCRSTRATMRIRALDDVRCGRPTCRASISRCIPPSAYEAAAITLYAARGRLIPFNSNSPTRSTFTTFSTFASTRGLIKICPGLASSHSREATLDTVPMAA